MERHKEVFIHLRHGTGEKPNNQFHSNIPYCRYLKKDG